MQHLNVYFCDFWDGFDKYDNIFLDALRVNFDVSIVESVDKTTNLIIYSCFGNDFLKYPTIKKLYFSGENDYPDFNQCDYAIAMSADISSERYMRLPLWYDYNRRYQNKVINIPTDLCNRKFCGSVISNAQYATPLRSNIIKAISQYKQVDNGGKLDNNVGGPVADKLEFLANYKFSIASENSLVPGYVTEKLFDSFVAHTIPIYLGDKEALNDFNPEAFINVGDYKTYGELIARIKEIDENNDLYLEILNKPRFKENNIIEDYKAKLADFLYMIITTGKAYNHKYGRIGMLRDIMSFLQ